MQGKKETLYYFILDVISKFATYLLLIIFANIFSTTQYGKATFIMTGFTFITLWMMIGSPHIFTAYIIREQQKSKSAYSFLLISTLIITILAGVAAIAINSIIWPLVLALPFFFFLETGRCFLRLEHRHHFIQILNAAYAILSLILILLLHAKESEGILVAYGATIILLSIYTFSLTYKHHVAYLKSFNVNTQNVIEYLKKAVVATTIFVSVDVLARTDSIVLGILSNFDNVARYNVAFSISTLIYSVPMAISLFLLTRSAELKDATTSTDVFKRCMRIAFSFSILIAIALISTINYVLSLFFSKYIGLEPIILIITMGLIYSSIHLLYFTKLSSGLKPEKAFVPIISGAATNLMLDVLLIPLFGLYGVAIATACAHLVTLILFGLNEFNLKQKICVYLSPIILIIAFTLNLFGMILIPISIYVIYKVELLTKSDVQVILNYLPIKITIKP